MTRVECRCLDQPTRFLRRVVGQAEDRDVGLVQELGARGRVLAALGSGST